MSGIICIYFLKVLIRLTVNKQKDSSFPTSLTPIWYLKHPVIWLHLICYELSYISSEIQMLKSQPPVPLSVAIFGDRVLKEVIRLT